MVYSRQTRLLALTVAEVLEVLTLRLIWSLYGWDAVWSGPEAPAQAATGQPGQPGPTPPRPPQTSLPSGELFNAGGPVSAPVPVRPGGACPVSYSTTAVPYNGGLLETVSVNSPSENTGAVVFSHHLQHFPE